MKRLKLLLLLLLPLHLFAQTTGQVTGIALDSLGNTVAGATITVCALGSSGIPCAPVTASTTSNGQGAFSVTVPVGTYTVTVFRLGVVATSSTVVVAPSNITVPNNIIGGTASFTNLTVSGTGTFTGRLNCTNFEGVRCVDGNNTQGWAGTDQGQRINSAMAATGTGYGPDDGKVMVFDSGTWSTNIFSGITRPFTIQLMGCPNITWTGTTEVPANIGMKLIGSNQNCSIIILNSATGDFIDPSADSFEMGWLKIQAGVTRTAGWAINPAGTATNGKYHDLFIQDTYNGIKFAGSGGKGPVGQTAWNIISQSISSAACGTFFQIGGGDGSIVSDITISNYYDTGDSLCTHATSKILIDSGVDTLNFFGLHSGLSQGSPTTVPVLTIQNSVPTNAPRWVTFSGQTSLEGGYNGTVTGADCYNITAANNVVFERLYAVNCARGVVYSGGNGLKIYGGVIANNKAGGFVNTAAIVAANLQLGHIDFTVNSRGATNTTDDVSIFNGTTQFKIVGASLGTSNVAVTTKSRYGINLGGTSTDLFTLVGNDCTIANMGTACINDPGGSTKALIQNTFDTSASALKIVGNCLSNNECLEVFDAGGQSWWLGERTAAGTFDIHNINNGQTWSFGSGVNFGGKFTHTNTAARTWTMPDLSSGVPVVFSCGNTGSGNQTCAPAAATVKTQIYEGESTLATNSAIITFPNAFASITSYFCVANDVTTRANPVQMVPTTTTTATITNTTGTTDVIQWFCIGQ